MSSRKRNLNSGNFVDRGDGTPLPAAVHELRQGDTFRVGSLPIHWSTQGDVECPNGIVLVSQTCDLVRENVAEAQACPVVLLESHEAREASTGRRPRYAPLPALGDKFFADLSVVATVHKQLLLDKEATPGLSPNSVDDQTRFSRAVGRRFDRFAFPDEVTPCLKPLQDIMRSKAPKSGPVAELARDIVELRLEARDGWGENGPYDLTMIVIVRAGTIPDPDIINTVAQGGTPTDTLAQVAASRPATGSSPDEVAQFWDRVTGALERLCRPSSSSTEAVRNAVRSFEVEIVAEDDLAYSRVRRSVEIDLDHLSDPGFM